MSVLAKGIISSIIVMSVVTPISAATLQDKFEVVKTKLLYLLSIDSFDEANLLVLNNTEIFFGTKLEGNWFYLEGLAAAKQGKIEQAGKLLRLLHYNPTENKDWLFDLAVVELKLNNPEAAKIALNEWLVENPDDYLGRYYLAMSNYQTENYEAAIVGLRALDADLKAGQSASLGGDQVSYLLAASAYKSKQYGLALRSAKKVVAMGGSEFEDSAKSIINNVRSERTKLWSVELSGKTSYDSNVTLAEGSEAQDDLRGTIQLDASVQPLPPLTLNYKGALTEHVEVSEYNLHSHKITAHFNPGFKQVTTGLGYSYSQSFLDREEWQHQHRLYVDTQWKKLSVSSEFIGLLYPNSESLSGYAIGVSGAYKLTKENAMPAISISMGAKANVNQQWQTQRIRVNTGAALVTALSGWQLQAKSDVNYTEYAPESVQDNKLMASTSLVGSRELITNLRLSLSADAFWVFASPDQFNYQRYVISSALAWRF